MPNEHSVASLLPPVKALLTSARSTSGSVQVHSGTSAAVIVTETGRCEALDSRELDASEATNVYEVSSAALQPTSTAPSEDAASFLSETILSVEPMLSFSSGSHSRTISRAVPLTSAVISSEVGRSSRLGRKKQDACQRESAMGRVSGLDNPFVVLQCCH